MQRRSSSSVRILYPKFDREHVIKKILERLPEVELRLPLKLIVLFGSYAKGNYTAASDIDLLVVYSGKRREDAYAQVKKVIDVRGLEPHIYSISEYKKLVKNIKNMTKDGIVLLDHMSKRRK